MVITSAISVDSDKAEQGKGVHDWVDGKAAPL